MLCIGLVIPLPMAKHKNIPIFIPHNGCPNQCVFCNQKTISGSVGYTLDSVKQDIESALATVDNGDTVEVAFFGGSFTGIDHSEMTALLAIAHSYLQQGKIQGIRLSTRPDYISEEILDILSSYGVTDIELGVQSLDDGVLGACARGHNAATTVHACRMILNYGRFTLVGQIMLGLPGASAHSEVSTVKELIDLGVRAFRIYPTVVLRDTPLADLLHYGAYTPLLLSEAVERAANVLKEILNVGGICLRIGLCENESLHGNHGILAGPFHPAFGELVLSEVFFENCKVALTNSQIPSQNKEITLCIPRGCLSKAIGQKRCNIKKLKEIYQINRIWFVESDDLTGCSVRIQEDYCIASQIT